MLEWEENETPYPVYKQTFLALASAICERPKLLSLYVKLC